MFPTTTATTTAADLQAAYQIADAALAVAYDIADKAEGGYGLICHEPAYLREAQQRYDAARDAYLETLPPVEELVIADDDHAAFMADFANANANGRLPHHIQA